MRKIIPALITLLGLFSGQSALCGMGSREEWQQPDRVMADLALKPGSKIADIGCGDGYFALRLARAVGAEGRVFAVDIDSGALNTLKQRADQAGLTNIQTVVSQPTDTRLEPESADSVFFCNVTHEVPAAHRPGLMKSAASALKRGGFLYLIDFRKSHEVTCDPYEKLIPREELVQLCEESGLKLDAEFHYLRFQVFLRFQKP